MKRALYVAITLILGSLGFSTSAVAAEYILVPFVFNTGDTMFIHELFGTESGSPTSQFDEWGITMDRNVSSCYNYDVNRALSPGWSPAAGGDYAKKATIGPSYRLDTDYYQGWACGYESAHCAYAQLWLHPIGSGPTVWSVAAWNYYSATEFNPEY